jgi:hypothetical protein
MVCKIINSVGKIFILACIAIFTYLHIASPRCQDKFPRSDISIRFTDVLSVTDITMAKSGTFWPYLTEKHSQTKLNGSRVFVSDFSTFISKSDTIYVLLEPLFASDVQTALTICGLRDNKEDPGEREKKEKNKY